MTYWLYVIVSAAGALLVGVIGTGSSLILLPALALIFTATLAEAAPLRLAAGTTMATMAVGAISGAIAQHRAGRVDTGLFRLSVVPYTLGAMAGAFLSRAIPTGFLGAYMSIVIGIVAVRMWRATPATAATRRPFHAHRFEIVIVLALIGIASSVAGIASGIFAIPYLCRFDVPVRSVIGTSTASAAVFASFGALGYVVAGWSEPGLPDGHFGFVYVPAFAAMATTALIVTPIGVRLASRVSEPALVRLFSLFLFAAAIAIALTSSGRFDGS